jgi:hypothetical protein
VPCHVVLTRVPSYSFPLHFFGRRKSNAAISMMISIASAKRTNVEGNPDGGAVVTVVDVVDVVVEVAAPTVKIESSVVIAVSSELMSELGAKLPLPSVSMQWIQYSL